MTHYAFYIHSWFSWITFLVISKNLKLHNDQILLILGRNFKVPSSKYESNSIRFESTENLILSSKSFQEKCRVVKDLFAHLSINSSTYELFIPHIAYEPFAIIAYSDIFHAFSYCQESIQVPFDTLIRRESQYLLDNNSSLYLSTDIALNRKMTKKYYTITNEIIPLHLTSVHLPGFVDEVATISAPTTNSFDFAIFAGKAQNHPLGIPFFSTVLSTYREFYPDSSILLKASPSSSSDIENWMSSVSDNLITYVPGDVSIESWIVKGQIDVIFTELFSLSALASLFSQSSKIVSLDKTLITDFPSFSRILTDRIQIKSYYQAAFKELSLSQYLISSLSLING